MQFSIFNNPLNTWQGSSLVVGIFEDEIYEYLEKFQFIFNPNSISENIKRKNFKGEKGQSLSFEFLDEKINSFSLIGLGKRNSFTNDSLRNHLSDFARNISNKEEKISILLPWEQLDKNAVNISFEAIRLSTFQDNRFNNKKDETNKLKEVEFILESKLSSICFKESESLCEGVEFARRLVAAPPNSLTPLEMSIKAKEIAKSHGLEVNILEKEECEELKMGAYLAVAKGSDLDPKFIHLIYKPEGPTRKKIALVGKGLTFDSGGYNLKVGASQIEMMKYDMGGSAAVLGAAKAIGGIKPKNIEIHFIIAACENMINGSAVHPGDVIKASNGKTIEINNTDAEGRLTLADALTYASNLKPDTIIDLATLTGACVIALGNDVAGLWSNNDNLAKNLVNSGKKAGENIWQMPLQRSYKDGLKSHIADMKNTGPRPGGSITAALFLEQFFDHNINWAHIDIAGTCWTDKNNGLNPSGATGFGVRTLVEWIKNIENS